MGKILFGSTVELLIIPFLFMIKFLKTTYICILRYTSSSPASLLFAVVPVWNEGEHGDLWHSGRAKKEVLHLQAFFYNSFSARPECFLSSKKLSKGAS